jgi:hypothetical protein
MTKMIVVVASIFATTSAMAIEYTSVDTLTTWCMSENVVTKIRCWRYIMRITRGLEVDRAIEIAPAICIPQDVTSDAVVATVIKMLGKTNRKDEPANTAIFIALQRAYPCEKKR